MNEGGTTNGAFLTEDAQCGGPLGMAPVLETLVDMLSKAMDTDISLDRGPVGEPEGVYLPGISREMDSIYGCPSGTQRTSRF